jgi:hemoglobin
VTVRTWYKQGQRHAYNRRMAVLNEVPEPSLYRRLGGYDAIAAIVDEIFALVRADPRFSRFGTGRGIDSHMRSRQLLVDQICSLSGGPCYYIGRDMKTSHAGLGITESEWTANLELTKQVLESKGVGSREQAEFLSLFERYKNDIVECSQSPAVSST